MTNLPPYFQSSIEQQKWDDGFKAGLKEVVPDLCDIMEETTDPTTVSKVEILLLKIEHLLG
jgi:hypothetical protein